MEDSYWWESVPETSDSEEPELSVPDSVEEVQVELPALVVSKEQHKPIEHTVEVDHSCKAESRIGKAVDTDTAV